MRQNVLATEIKSSVSINNYLSCNYLNTIEIQKYHPMDINRPKEPECKMSNTPKFHNMPSYPKLCPH